MLYDVVSKMEKCFWNKSCRWTITSLGYWEFWITFRHSRKKLDVTSFSLIFFYYFTRPKLMKTPYYLEDSKIIFTQKEAFSLEEAPMWLVSCSRFSPPKVKLFHEVPPHTPSPGVKVHTADWTGFEAFLDGRSGHQGWFCQFLLQYNLNYPPFQSICGSLS